MLVLLLLARLPNGAQDDNFCSSFFFLLLLLLLLPPPPLPVEVTTLAPVSCVRMKMPFLCSSSRMSAMQLEPKKAACSTVMTGACPKGSCGSPVVVLYTVMVQCWHSSSPSRGCHPSVLMGVAHKRTINFFASCICVCKWPTKKKDKRKRR